MTRQISLVLDILLYLWSKLLSIVISQTNIQSSQALFLQHPYKKIHWLTKFLLPIFLKQILKILESGIWVDSTWSGSDLTWLNRSWLELILIVTDWGYKLNRIDTNPKKIHHITVQQTDTSHQYQMFVDTDMNFLDPYSTRYIRGRWNKHTLHTWTANEHWLPDHKVIRYQTQGILNNSIHSH